MGDIRFHSPTSLVDLCQIIAETDGKIIAGGTDLIPRMRKYSLPSRSLIDLSRVSELHFIEEANGRIHIGARTTFNEIIHSKLLRKAAPILVEAARCVGCEQIRNRATLGGNIANASPAGDSLPPLLILEAEVLLHSVRGERSAPLTELFLGPGEADIGPDEVIHSVSFNLLDDNTESKFLRLGNRQGMTVAVASVAIALLLGGDDQIMDVRLALGAVAPIPMRCTNVESLLVGERVTPELIKIAAVIASEACSPISDVRGTEKYRRHLVKQLVIQGLQMSSGTKKLEG